MENEVITFELVTSLSDHADTCFAKDFYYSTPKMHVDPDITVLGKSLIGSKTFHLICTPARCITIVKKVLEERSSLDRRSGNVMMKPIFVWEPSPDSCTPGELPELYEALKYVDVVSPNLVELEAFFKKDVDHNQVEPKLEWMCDQLLALGFGNRPSAVVVRRGAQGSYVAQAGRHVRIRAYHRTPSDLNEEERKTSKSEVVDPTGAGNSFLGGFCIGLLDDPHPRGWTCYETAAIYGSVAASFIIEQFGMPKLSVDENLERELWNGEAVRDRLIRLEELLDPPALDK